MAGGRINRRLRCSVQWLMACWVGLCVLGEADTVIRPATQSMISGADARGSPDPGGCWAMEGSRGNITIELLKEIVPRKLVLQVPRAHARGCTHNRTRAGFLFGARGSAPRLRP